MVTNNGSKDFEKDQKMDDIKTLLELMQHKESSVRESAVRKMGDINDPLVIQPLLDALKDEDGDVRVAAAEALLKMTNLTSAMLEGALKNESHNVRRGAVMVICEKGGPRAFEALLLALKDPDWKVRVLAANGLGKMKEFRAVEPLIQLLEDDDPDVRNAAINALGEIADKSAVPSIIESLKRDIIVNKISAANALAHIGDKTAVKPLIEVLNDRHPGLVKRESRKPSAERLNGDEVQETMVADVLGHEYISVCRAVAAALGKIGDPEAIEYLIQALKSEDWSLRKVVAESLGNFSDNKIVAPLISCLKDKNWMVRRTAADSLCKLDITCLDPLKVLLKDDDSTTRALAVEILGIMGDESILDTFIELANDSDPKVRLKVAEALGKFANVKAKDCLEKMINDDNIKVKEAAYTALSKIRKEQCQQKF